MRRFVQAWGRQEPALLCPAEAASPPPLSTFYSPRFTQLTLPSITTSDPSAELLFSNIERQISAAKLSPDSQQQLFCAQLSPGQAQADRQLQLQQNSARGSITDLLASTGPPARDAVTTAANTNIIPPGPPAQQKGLDAFFAALNGANPAAAENGPRLQPPATTDLDVAAQFQQQQSQQPLTVLSQAFGATQQPQQLLSTIEPSSESHQQQTTTTEAVAATNVPQQLAQSIQAAANNVIASAANNALANAVIANAMNAAAANVIANAASAVVAQQQQQAAALDVPSSLLANLKPSLLQKQQQQQANDQQLAANAIQLAQSAIQQHQQKQQQQQLQQQLQRVGGGPISPGDLVQAALLNRLTAQQPPPPPPNILRPPGPSCQSKPIPLLESKVDLLQFRVKEPREWGSDDVVAWILDVARRHQIPCENINLAKFASCTGPLLMLMNEQSFKEHDPSYGSLLFGEFCKLVTDENFIDEWMRSAGPSHQQQASQQQQQQQQTMAAANTAMGNLLAANLALQKFAAAPEPGPSSTVQQQQPNLLFAAAAAGIAAVQQQHQQQNGTAVGLPTLGQLLPATMPTTASLLGSLQPQTLGGNQMVKMLPMAGSSQHQMAMSSSRMGTSAAAGLRPTRTGSSKAEQKVRRNKDGRPRKRSQHTKGNKLWEFIRDALKDPRTCPSIVRWEDPSEGVFRIIESERLACLWGQKKNNQKMTYEKLSRAMRTYYEKEILVPVPKSGLYPKKLVYKFGPSAMGWKMAASIAVQSHLAAAAHHHI